MTSPHRAVFSQTVHAEKLLPCLAVGGLVNEWVWRVTFRLRGQLDEAINPAARQLWIQLL